MAAIDLIGSTVYEVNWKLNMIVKKNVAFGVKKYLLYGQFECLLRSYSYRRPDRVLRHSMPEFDYIKSLRRLTAKDIEVGGGIL